ncbi:dihydroorotase family protein [Streptomyces griseorubiginosus]|uniref:dihydroorotase n=1 Tax=Streptomyces griseorubiginosus TaxID=67304 RepID=UPI0033B0E103
MTYDLLVRGGQVVLDDGVRHGDIAVRDGRIAALYPPRSISPAAGEIDATGLFVLPGLIDSHVHFRTPGLTYKEEWATGSRAAAAGGVTTVIDMPNTQPPLFTPQDAHNRHEMIKGNSLVDYLFHAGVDPECVEAITEFTPAEATSIKVFLTGHHTAPHVLSDPTLLDRLFRLAAQQHLRLLFHAEDDAVFQLLDRWQGPPATPTDYERHRPRTGAIVAVARLVDLIHRHGTPTHVLHVSTTEEADLLTAAAASGLPITFEVTGHHLTFTDDDIRALGPRIRLSPAIRGRKDRDRLWQAVVGGEAATVGSDHAPHEAKDKLLPAADAPPGLPGVQELLPALFTGLRRRRPADPREQLLAIVQRVLAREPARLFGLTERKGRIAPGLDADLVLFDASAPWFMEPSLVQSKCGWSAYEGRSFTGRVVTTIRRGEVVYTNRGGTPAFGPASGMWLSPAVC